MSILTQINKLNIPAEELVNLTDKELIRIEKRLKAEVKMGGSLDMNEVNSILKLLKDNQEELHIFLDEKFKWLRRILADPKTIVFFPLSHSGLIDLDDELQDFITVNFKTELIDYSAFCLYQNHYRALNSFLAYHPVLPEEIKEDIQGKMMQKIKFGIECIDIKVNNISEKIIHLYNPFFFRSINFLENIHFEDLINELTNSLINRVDKEKQLTRALYAMANFKSSDAEMRSVLSQNRAYAIDRGVGEVSNFKKHPKGGTTNKQLLGTSDFNLRNLMWIVVVVIFFAMRIGGTCNRSSRNNTSINVESLIEMRQKLDVLPDFNEEQ
ncbi:MAG: hypothetical protein ABF242_03415 [Flavobacteriales bacterium]